MKKFFVCLLALCASAGLFAQQPVVAIEPINAISGISSAEANIITRVFYICLGNTGKVRVVDRNVLEQVLREHDFQADDWSDKVKTAELNKALNADWLVRSELEKFGSSILVTVRFVNIKTFQQMGGTYLRLANAEAAYDNMDTLVDSLVKTISGTGNPPPPPPPVPTYKIGDRGPAGGIVFFDRGFTGDGWRYLEAAPAGAEFTAQWGAYEKNVANTMTAVGFGKQNTQIITDRLKTLGETNRAAQICAALDINGYKDWFLPSKDELDLMYRNLKQKGLGGFKDTWYWSSSQYNNKYAWFQNFSSGNQFDYAKNVTISVRAVRAF